MYPGLGQAIAPVTLRIYMMPEECNNACDALVPSTNTL